MTVKSVIKQMPTAFNPDAAMDVDAIIQYNVSEPMYAKISDGSCSVHDGQHDDPTITLSADDADLEQVLRGQIDGVTAFMTGKLTIDGDMMFAQRMNSFFDMSRIS